MYACERDATLGYPLSRSRASLRARDRRLCDAGRHRLLACDKEIRRKGRARRDPALVPARLAAPLRPCKTPH